MPDQPKPVAEETFQLSGEIVKSDAQVDREGREYTLVTSAWMSCDKIDKQDDWTDEAELQDALHDFAMRLQKQLDPQESGMSYRHQRMVTQDQASVVELFLMRKGDVWQGKQFPRTTAMITTRVYDPKLRKEILSGELRGMSVEGFAKRIPQPLPE